MKKNTVRLTESQLHRVIKESVNNVLKENVFGTYNNKERRKDDRWNSTNKFHEAIRDIQLGVRQIYSAIDWDNPRLAKSFGDKIATIDKISKELPNYYTAIANQDKNYAVGNRNISIHDGQDELNAKLFNPYTQKYETMNVTKAAMIVNKLFKETDENLEAMGGYRDKYGDIGFGEDSCDMEFVKRYGPVRALEWMTKNCEEPEDWYERNEHGDFDEY